jgi:hypothetical protein
MTTVRRTLRQLWPFRGYGQAKLLPTFTRAAASAERIGASLDQPSEHLGSARRLPCRVGDEIELPGVASDYWLGPVLTGPDPLVLQDTAGGIGLSGGRRRRVGVARALLVCWTSPPLHRTSTPRSSLCRH